MPKLTFADLQKRKTIDLVIRPKHVRGNKCHAGNKCPAALAAIDLVDVSTLAPFSGHRYPEGLWAMHAALVFTAAGEHYQSVKFHSKKLCDAIQKFDKGESTGKEKFPVGVYRLRRVD